MSEIVSLRDKPPGYRKRKEQPNRLDFVDEFTSSALSAKCSSTLYEQHKLPGAFHRGNMKSFKKSRSDFSKRNLEIDLTSELPFNSSEPCDNIMQIMSEAKSTLSTTSQSHLQGTSQSPSQAFGYVKVVCSQTNKRSVLLSSKQHSGVFDDCDLGFESKCANFESSVDDVRLQSNDTASGSLAPIQLFEIQQKSLDAGPVTKSCHDTVSYDEEVNASDLDVGAVSSDDLLYSKRKLCGTDIPNCPSEKKHASRLWMKKSHSSGSNLNNMPSLSKNDFTVFVPSEDMYMSDNTVKEQIVSKSKNGKLQVHVSPQHGSLKRNPLHSIEVSEESRIPMNVSNVLRQHGVQPKHTVSQQNKCLKCVHPPQDFNIPVGVSSFQVGKNIVDRSFSLEVDGECLRLLQIDTELEFSISHDEVEQWKISFEEDPLIAMKLQAGVFRRINSYMTTKHMTIVHSSSNYIAAPWLVLKLQEPASAKTKRLFQILQNHRNSSTFDVLKMTPTESKKFSESMKCARSTPVEKCDQPELVVGDMFTQPAYRRTTRSSTRSFHSNKSNRVVKENCLVLMYKPLDSKLSFDITTLDMESLDPEEYVNDKIMDFYLNYLLFEKLSKEQRSQVHIFNTFFYTRLSNTTLDNKQQQLSTPERIHNRVKNWTRHVDIFEKKFVIFPVCDRAHWFVAIVCCPGEYIAVSPKPRTSYSTRTSKRRTVKRKRKGMKVATSMPSSKQDHTEDTQDNLQPTAYHRSSVEEESGYCPDYCTQKVFKVSEAEEFHSGVDLVDKELNSKAEESSSRSTQVNDILDGIDLKTYAAAKKEVTGMSGAMDKYADVYFEEMSTVDEKGVMKMEHDESNSTETIRPCVLILDSLGIKRPTASRRIRSYLTMEWKLKKANLEEKIYDGLPVKYPKIPLQDNSSDCGIFVLQFVESLLLFSSEHSTLPASEENWASYDQVRVKRVEIRRVIMELTEANNHSSVTNSANIF